MAQFPRARSALIVSPGSKSDVLLELYSRPGGALLTAKEHRLGTVCVSRAGAAVEAIAVTLRMPGDAHGVLAGQKAQTKFGVQGKSDELVFGGIKAPVKGPVLKLSL